MDVRPGEGWPKAPTVLRPGLLTPRPAARRLFSPGAPYVVEAEQLFQLDRRGNRLLKAALSIFFFKNME